VFNTLKVIIDGRELDVQFKVGHARFEPYRVGEKIEDINITNVIPGLWYEKACPIKYFAVSIEDGFIRAVEEVDESTYEDIFDSGDGIYGAIRRLLRAFGFGVKTQKG
jgi:hypothetical protein